MQQTHKLFFDIMEIAQKWHNANMTGQTMDEQTAKADGLEILNLAREIINQNDPAGQIQTPMDELIDNLADMMDTINGCCFEIEQTIAPQIQNKELREHLIAENSDLDDQGTILEEIIAKYSRKTI